MVSENESNIVPSLVENSATLYFELCKRGPVLSYVSEVLQLINITNTIARNLILINLNHNQNISVEGRHKVLTKYKQTNEMYSKSETRPGESKS